MSLPELSYEKVWTSPEDFPTFEGSEEQVRLDNQYHPDAIKNYINDDLLPALQGTGKGKGASCVGVFPVTGLGNVSDVQSALEAILVLLQNISQGAIPDGSISSAKLAAASVLTAALADSAVTGAKLATGSVTVNKIGSGAVTAAKLGSSAVEAEKIKDGAVGEVKVATGAVTATKIATGAVTTDKIGYAAVTSAKVADSAVTNAKLAPGAVTAAKINDGSVVKAKIADGAITSAKFASDAVAPAATTATKATQLATSRNLTVKDSSGTYSGTAAGFNGTAAATLKMPASAKFDRIIAGSSLAGTSFPSNPVEGQIFFKY